MTMLIDTHVARLMPGCEQAVGLTDDNLWVKL